MKRNTSQHPAALTNRTTFKVRFSEVDSMQIVWHGEYVRYFEDGREAFGKQYGLDYMSIYHHGYLAPLVDLQCQFKRPLTVGEEAIVETRYIACEAAKVQFEYVIYRASDQSVVATGSTVQVFLDKERELQLLNPPFYAEWKERWNIR
ncbi:MAG: acyl-CoA thioesterase [Mediterranea sp.]|jgi:acyl-CoA thioester hydrolase|nr:acyl-CoA thioesterase [Mediterranea sp.]